MYRVEITNKEAYVFKSQEGAFEFAINPDKNSGVTPPGVLLSAIGSCLGVYLRKYAEGAKLPLGEFNVIVEAEFSKEPPICFRNISVSIDLKGLKIDEKRAKSLLEFIKNCPVHNTLKNSPQVEIKLLT